MHVCYHRTLRYADEIELSVQRRLVLYDELVRSLGILAVGLLLVLQQQYDGMFVVRVRYIGSMYADVAPDTGIYYMILTGIIGCIGFAYHWPYYFYVLFSYLQRSCHTPHSRGISSYLGLYVAWACTEYVRTTFSPAQSVARHFYACTSQYAESHPAICIFFHARHNNILGSIL